MVVTELVRFAIRRSKLRLEGKARSGEAKGGERASTNASMVEQSWAPGEGARIEG